MSNSTVVTRKDMKEPDKFQSTANQAVSWLRTRKKHVMLAAGLAVLALVVLAFVSVVQTSREQTAGAAADGMFKAMTGVVAPSPIPGTQTFATDEARQRAVIAAADGIIASHGGTRQAELALLAKGDAHYALREWDAAKDAYEKFLSTASRDHSLRFGALEGLGLVAEAKGDIDGALKAYDRLGSETSFSDRADLDRAALLARNGRAAEAKEILSGFTRKHEKSPLVQEAAQKLAALGGQ
jgi:tetratricopeptide (TPR) repeat protein